MNTIMNQQDINQLLRELTPEARNYLFPGLFGDDFFDKIDHSRSFIQVEEKGNKWFKGAALFFSTKKEQKAPGCPTTAAEHPEPDEEEFADNSPLPDPIPEPDEESLVNDFPDLEEGGPNYFFIPDYKSSKETTADIFETDKEAEAEIPDSDADKLNARTELLLAEIRRLQEKYHVSIDELESLLGYTVKLSPLRILRSGKMYLSYYNNTEIRMPNVAKALFFLYLRHPEGLRFKDVADHKKELVELYGNITGRDNPEEIEKSIDLLTDPFGNALNVNASRIKTAFRNAVSDRIARHYYINGAAGEIKKVPLNRDLVVWEH